MTSPASPKTKTSSFPKRVLVIALCALPVFVGIAVVFVLSALSDHGEPSLPTKLSPGVAAQVGETVIKDAAIKRWLQAINPDAKAGEYTDSDIANALDVVALNAWVDHEAARRGMTVTATEIAAMEVGAVKGAPAADLNAYRQRLALLNKMAGQEAGPVPHASTAEVEAKARELAAHIGRPEVRAFFEVAAKSRSKVTRAVERVRGGMAPAEAVAKFSDDPVLIATDGFNPGATAKELPIEVAADVFAAELRDPTEPVEVGGRWRTYVVTEVLPEKPAPSLERLRRSARYDLTEGAHAAKVEDAREVLLAQARAATACSTASYVSSACGGKATTAAPEQG